MKRPDEKRMAAWESLLRAHHALVRRMSTELENRHDLPLPWYEVLLRLNNAPAKRLRMQELAGAAFFSPSGMTRVVDRMCEAGLVERHTCDTDRRGVHVVLTAEGKDRLRSASATHMRDIQELFGCHLSDDEAQAVAAALSRVADSLA